ncbi:MAG: diacylglycerol kinase family lipid kinase [Acidobacteria bacterium]|nr:MAG: diacylglycerol kinase family lipid kinase [Acidobacteriota bacterium]
MKTRLIVNPVSGRDQAPDVLPAVNERLRAAFGEVEIVMTIGEGDGEHSARRAAEDGCRRIIVAGGDGTLNEALNGVAAAGALDDTVFGVVPLGTGNDFATVLGLPDDPLDAAERVAAGLERRVDLGVLHERVFVNASAGGFVAEVSDALSSGLKTIAGRMAYVIAGAGVLMDFEPPSVEARFGDEVIPRRPCQLFVVCNGQTIGGGHRVAPHARLDDGLLDVCLVEASTATEFLTLLRRISNGDHLGDPLVTYRQFREGELSFDRVIKVNTDGEVRQADRCRYRVMPGAARFLT